MVNISKKMTKVLPKKIVRLLKDIGELANSLGYPAYVVGGLVRDLMLGRNNFDLDIVVEGDGIKVAQELSKKLSAAIVVHKQFGTCTVTVKGDLKIDFATARKEVYKRPGAFPTVTFSTIKEDLFRRDFTINAMAVSINEDSFGRLIDFFGGEKDLMAGRIKVMHDKSFIDDPTRIFRAVRFEIRLGFSTDPRTLQLIKAAIQQGMPAKVSRQRLQKELTLILREKDKIKMLKRLEKLNIGIIEDFKL